MATLGIDISKKDFYVTLIDEQDQVHHQQFDNTPTGFKQLHHWLNQHAVTTLQVCMEATNIYWEDVALFLHQQGYQVSVVNPARIKGFAQSQLQRNKTDKQDSQLIALFCKLTQPKVWTPPTPEQQTLRALVRHLQTLLKELTRQTNRLRDCRTEQVKASLQEVIKTLKTQIKSIQQQAQAFIDEHPDLKKKQQRLMSIKGIGAKTAMVLIAEMYDLSEYKNARAAAADAGVTPSRYESGTSVRRRARMSKMGKASVREILYLCAVTAMTHNPIMQAFKERLLKKGKSKKVIIVAIMRKLVHLAYGVLKHDKPFDPNYVK
jgi:transposase